MPKTIDTAALHRLRKGHEGFLLVDVADAMVFAKDHIPGACNVPLADAAFAQTVASRLAGNKTRRIVIYGAGLPDATSSAACARLLAAGFTNVLEYAGGLSEWNGSRRPNGRPSRTP